MQQGRRGGSPATRSLDDLVRLADAVDRQWVAAQIGQAAVVIEPARLVELVEHAGHADGRKTGFAHQREAGSVGFALHVARKIELGLDHRRLATNDRRLRRVGAGGAARHQQAQQHRRHAQRAAARVGGHAARDVAPRDVRQLMRQHRGQLVGCGGQRHQPQVNADKSAGQRKGVDRAVAHQEGLVGEQLFGVGADVTARPGCLHQRLPQRLQVVEQLRVVDVVGVAPDLAHDLFAGALFLAQAEVFRGRLAQRWQPHPGRGLGLNRRRCAQPQAGRKQQA